MFGTSGDAEIEVALVSCLSSAIATHDDLDQSAMLKYHLSPRPKLRLELSTKLDSAIPMLKETCQPHLRGRCCPSLQVQVNQGRRRRALSIRARDDVKHPWTSKVRVSMFAITHLLYIYTIQQLLYVQN
jgi:hypothetical protein